MGEQSDHAADGSIIEDVNQIYRLVLSFGWIMHRRLTQELISFHLTAPQFVTLLFVRHHGGGCMMSELAEATQEVSATMTGIIDRLVERQLVKRTRDVNDRRSYRVSLTETGEELLISVEQIKRSRLLRILGHISLEDRKEMLRLMQLYLDTYLSESDRESA